MVFCFPDSHLYESLLSRASESSRAQIAFGDTDEESIYQKISFGDSTEEILGKVSARGEADFEGRNPFGGIEERTEDNAGGKSPRAEKFPGNLKTKGDGSRKWTPTDFASFENSESRVKESVGKRYIKKLSFRQSFSNYTSKNNSKNYFKLFFKKRKKENKRENEESPVHTVISVVHDDKASLRNANNPKLSENNFLKSYEKYGNLSDSYSDNSDALLTKGRGTHQGFDILISEKNPLQKPLQIQQTDSKSSSSSFHKNSYYQQTSVIPTTVELLESAPSKSYLIPAKMVYKNDKSVQVSFEDIVAQSQNKYKEISTLDPLRSAISTPDFSSTNCKNCQRQKQKEKKILSKNKIRHSQSIKISPPSFSKMPLPPLPSASTINKASLDSSNKSTQLLTTDESSNFDSTNNSSNFDDIQIKHKKKNKINGDRPNYFSNIQFYSLNSRSSNPYVYACQSQKCSDRSSALSSQDYRDQTSLRSHSQINLQVKQTR